MKAEVDVHLTPPIEDQHYSLLQDLGEPRQLVLILVLRIDMDAYLTTYYRKPLKYYWNTCF